MRLRKADLLILLIIVLSVLTIYLVFCKYDTSVIYTLISIIITLCGVNVKDMIKHRKDKSETKG